MFVRGKGQLRGDQLLATVRPKDYMHMASEVAIVECSEAGALMMTPTKRLRKQKWPKSPALLSDPHAMAGSTMGGRPPFKSLSTGHVGIVRRRSPSRSRSDLMELRPCMCRWPIGDPQHFATFRFCGSGCPSGAVYCKTHDAKAHAPNRPRTLRMNKLQGQPAAIVA